MRGRQKVLRLRDGPPSQRPLQNHFETSHKTIPPEEHLSVGFESQNPSFIQIGAGSVRADSVRADSVRADSCFATLTVRADSVRADSVRADSC